VSKAGHSLQKLDRISALQSKDLNQNQASNDPQFANKNLLHRTQNQKLV
jgi:hypothetical protein